MDLYFSQGHQGYLLGIQLGAFNTGNGRYSFTWDTRCSRDGTTLNGQGAIFVTAGSIPNLVSSPLVPVTLDNPNTPAGYCNSGPPAKPYNATFDSFAFPTPGSEAPGVYGFSDEYMDPNYNLTIGIPNPPRSIPICSPPLCYELPWGPNEIYAGVPITGDPALASYLTADSCFVVNGNPPGLTVFCGPYQFGMFPYGETALAYTKDFWGRPEPQLAVVMQDCPSLGLDCLVHYDLRVDGVRTHMVTYGPDIMSNIFIDVAGVDAPNVAIVYATITRPSSPQSVHVAISADAGSTWKFFPDDSTNPNDPNDPNDLNTTLPGSGASVRFSGGLIYLAYNRYSPISQQGANPPLSGECTVPTPSGWGSQDLMLARINPTDLTVPQQEIVDLALGARCEGKTALIIDTNGNPGILYGVGGLLTPGITYAWRSETDSSKRFWHIEPIDITGGAACFLKSASFGWGSQLNATFGGVCSGTEEVVWRH